MRIVRIVSCFCLLLMGILVISQPALALDPLEEGEQRLNVDVTYQSVEVTPGGSCEFVVNVIYATYERTGDPLNFNLVTTGPKNWAIYITEEYKKDVKIRSIRLDPFMAAGSNVRVVVTTPAWYVLEPGEYTITLEVVSEDEELRNSVELKAIIVANYVINLIPSTERYNTSATAGKDNYYSVELLNIGSASVDDVAFSSDKPEEWAVTFSPDGIDSLAADSSREIEVNIKPPPGTIAGDYNITLKTEGKQTSARDFALRVTVETPTIWGWVGVGIIVLVIAGIVFVFMRFSRR